MKIAILTLRLHVNYGGILQAYALMTTLKCLGHEPWLIFNQPFTYRKWYSLWGVFLVNAFKKFVLGEKNLEVFRERRIRREFETVYTNVLRFVDEHLKPRTHIVCTKREWRRLQKEYAFDAYVVGSDQVWRPSYAKPIARYFLSFLTKKDEVKRIAYAASFGVDEWTFTPKETAECRSLLKKFDAVSVREESGVELCRTRLGRDACHVLDPTMLLSREDYTALLKDKDVKKSGIMVYVLDKSEWKDAVVGKMEEALGMQAFSVNNQVSVSDRVAPPVEDWLRGFASAEFVVTDSFHASVFAILFHVPFLVCVNRERGAARMMSLLEMFGLEDCLVDEACNVSEIKQCCPIDWSAVDRRLNAMRDYSIDFLRASLK